MPQTKYIQNNFNGGILAPQMFGRQDLARYYTSIADCENFIPTIFGSVHRRPGLRFFGLALGPSRLIPFRLNVAHTYLIEVGDHFIRFINPNGLIFNGPNPVKIASPWGTADNLWLIKFVQQNDVMYLVHPSFPIYRLNHITDTDWTLTAPSFDSPAIDRFNTDISGGSVTVQLSAVSGNAAIATASALVFMQGDIGKLLISGQGAGYIQSLAGATGGGALGATLYPQAVIQIVDPFETTGPFAAGNWFLFGSPQSYLCIGTIGNVGSVNGNNLFYATTKLGIGGLQHAYTLSDYPDEAQGGTGNTPPPPTDSFRPSDVGRWIIGDGAVMKIVSLTNSAQAEVQLYSPINQTFSDLVGKIRALPISGGAWSINDPVFTAARGYAQAIAFFQDRLWLGGSNAKATTAYSSVTGDYENFAPGSLDDQAMIFTENSGQFDNILWMEPFQGQLVTGNLQSEWAIGSGGFGSNGSAVTPTNINTLVQSLFGSSVVQAILVENQLLYVQRALTKIFEFSFSIYQSVFSSKDLTTFAAVLDPSGFKEMIYQQTPDRIVWFTTNDGVLYGLTYKRDDDVWGWHRHITGTPGAGAGGGGGGGGPIPPGAVQKLIASGANNLILTSDDGGQTWTSRHADDASTNNLTIGAWDGKHAYVLCGGDNSTADGLWASVNDGVTWAKVTTPAGMKFGLPENLGQLTDILRTLTHDGKQFICVGWLTPIAGYSQGIVGTSVDAVTWNFRNLGPMGSGAHSGRFIGVASNGTRCVALEWNSDIAGPGPNSNQPSSFWTSVDLTNWSVVFTSTIEDQYAWIGANPKGGFLVLAANQNATFTPNTRTAYAASSSDGLAWKETSSGVVVNFERRQSMWDVLTSQWIVSGFDDSLDIPTGTSRVVIRTSPDGFMWTTRLDLGFGSLVGNSQFCGTVLRGLNGNLYAWLDSGTGDPGNPPYTGNGQPWVSADGGMNWTSVSDPIPETQPGHLIFNGTKFVSLNITANPTFVNDNFLAVSGDASTWANKFDDTNFDLITVQQFVADNQASLPEGPPTTGGVADAILSIGVMTSSNGLSDDLWAIVGRGSLGFFLEKFDPTLNTDAATETDLGAKFGGVGGFGYLAGRTISIKGDGAYFGDFLVPTSGEITFQRGFTAQVVEGGIPYDSTLTSLPIEVKGGSNNQGYLKRFSKLWVRVLNTVGLKVNGQHINFRKPSMKMDTAVPAQTLDVSVKDLGSKRVLTWEIIQDQPFSAEVLAVFGDLEIGEN
jgi:hypothetical protein